MLTLYVSTDVCTTQKEIANMMAPQGVECQVSNNCSAFKVAGECVQENGFKIKIFNLDKEDFKEKVWNTLQSELHLRCAHVKYQDEYKGCVLNWPGVFVESRCGWKESPGVEEGDETPLASATASQN